MPEDSDKSKRELLRKFTKIEEIAKKAQNADIKFPSSVVLKLCRGAICYTRAEKKLSKGKRKEATKEMQKATGYVNDVLSNMSHIFSREQDLFECGKDIGNGKDIVIVKPVIPVIIVVADTNPHNLGTTSVKSSNWKHKVKKILLWLLARGVEAIVQYTLTQSFGK